MEKPIRILIETAATGPVAAVLHPDRCPRTVAAIQAALPITGVAHRWGEEVYFQIPVQAGPESQLEVVKRGELGYWPAGNALCIFFGPTPASRSPDEIRPASPVNPVGRVLGDPHVFGKVQDGEEIVVKLAQD